MKRERSNGSLDDWRVGSLNSPFWTRARRVGKVHRPISIFLVEMEAPQIVQRFGGAIVRQRQLFEIDIFSSSVRLSKGFQSRPSARCIGR